MMSESEMDGAMSNVRDRILEIMESHEIRAHAGKACMSNRASVVAYVAHCIGVRGEAWNYAEQLRQDYDRSCRFENCTHKIQDAN